MLTSAITRAFVDWARSSLIPLSSMTAAGSRNDIAPLGRIVGNATVIALGEPGHLAKEPLEFRNRLLQYLVAEKRFTAIALESGLVEGRVVHDYVRGGPGELATVIARGISWTFDRLPQNHSLVQWLREYNSNLQHPRKVNFYGFDVPGSPANCKAARGHETAIAEVLQYLRRVDSGSAIAFDSRFRPFLGKLQFSWDGLPNGSSYGCLSQDQRDALTATVADVLAFIERKEAAFIAASSEEDYKWGHRAAICAQQMDQWLRQIPFEWHATDFTTPTLEQMCPVVNAANVRDRAQADNLDWIFRREGPQGRTLVFADRGHLGMTALHKEVQGARVTHEVAGTYLIRRLGNRLVTVATIVGGGELGVGDYRQTVPELSVESLELLARRVGVPFFALDMRSAPPAVRSWLDQEQRLGIPNVVCQTIPGKEFDVLLYIDKVTPAS